MDQSLLVCVCDLAFINVQGIQYETSGAKILSVHTLN